MKDFSSLSAERVIVPLSLSDQSMYNVCLLIVFQVITRFFLLYYTSPVWFILLSDWSHNSLPCSVCNTTIQCPIETSMLRATDTV